MSIAIDYFLSPQSPWTYLGHERFAEIARGATLPVYAIGGLTRADLKDAWRAGAHGVAMIRGAWS